MDSNALLISLQDKLPKDQMKLHALKERFDAMSDEKRQDFALKTSMLGLCNPTLVFWVGAFLLGTWGIAWFMLKNMPLFGAKLGVWIVMAICYGIAVFTQSPVLISIASFLELVVLVWWIVDLFLVGKKAREINYQKIMQAVA